MPRIIIADTTCLIVLTNIGELALLQRLYGRILTTPEVATEYGEALPDWVDVCSVKDTERQRLLRLQVDAGESSAIALALETAEDCTLILDDYRARRIAVALHLSVTGTVGVLIKAKERGLVMSIRPLLERLLAAGLWISDELQEQALRLAGEA